MEQLSLLENKYIYFPEFNSLINIEFKDFFLKNIKYNNDDQDAIKISQSLLKNKVTKLKQIIFEVTQDCNLRCKYCAFGGSYKYNRPHSKNSMDFNIARKGIDYIYSIISKRRNKEFSLGFYGGEPLLNFGLIKDVVKYAKKKINNFRLSFFITTNGTLLNDLTINYFIKNNFILSISLDGPKEIHDSSRIFPNGKGTFELIIKKLEKIKKLNESYFYNNVRIISTLQDKFSLKDIYPFFTKNKLIKNLELSNSLVDTKNRNYHDNELTDYNRQSETIKYIMPKIREKKKKEYRCTKLKKISLNQY